MDESADPGSVNPLHAPPASSSHVKLADVEASVGTDKPKASAGGGNGFNVKVVVISAVVALVALGLGILIGYVARQPATTEDSKEHLEWGYTCKVGPQYWGELSPEYALCKTGRSQSPINIMTSLTTTVAGNTPLVYNYSSLLNHAELDARSSHPGFKIVPVPAQAADRGFLVDGVLYQLKQFHFHSPSEHTVNGMSYPLEMHMVHMDRNGNVAVLGMLFKDGTGNHTFLNSFWDDMRETHLAINDIDLTTMLSTIGTNYWRYDGSFTTPPCTEGVKWFVAETSSEVSEAQVAEFLSVVHPNARPTLSRYSRVVRKYTR